MFEHVEMHGNVAAPGVLAEDGGTEIPARVADARQLFAGVARLERRGGQHGPIVERGCAGMGGRAHARASGGRKSRSLSICRSEEHTSELQSLMRISYAVFCLKKKKTVSSDAQLTYNHTIRVSTQ